MTNREGKSAGSVRHSEFRCHFLSLLIAGAFLATGTTGLVQGLVPHQKPFTSRWSSRPAVHSQVPLKVSFQQQEFSRRYPRKRERLWNALVGLTSPKEDRHDDWTVVDRNGLQQDLQRSISGTDVATAGTAASTSLEKSSSKERSSKMEGRALLLLAALLLGTLNTTIRMVYAIPVNGKSIDPWAMSVIRSWMATFCFVPLWWMSKKQQQQQQPQEIAQPPIQSTDGLSGSISKNSPPMWKAALELTIWNFGSRALWNIGLVTTPSARASFLIQLSVVLTPCLSLLAGKAVRSSVLVACALALSGLSLVSGLSVPFFTRLFGTAVAQTTAAGTTTAAAVAATSFGSGELLILAGTLCWSLYMFRLSLIGHRYEGIKLQTVKTILLSAFYSLWFGATQCIPLWLGKGAAAATGSAAMTAAAATTAGVWSSVSSSVAAISPVIWILLFYSALGPGTVAAISQHRGQGKVSTASEANVILSMESVFSALTAVFVLGEVMTLPETVGGGLILFAALVATRQ